MSASACRPAASATATRSPNSASCPASNIPRIPGHEVAGIVDAVGPDVPLFKPGQRVGLGWHGGHCNYCPPCRRGDFILCENASSPASTIDGGYADYVIAPANALAFIPDDLIRP